MHESTNIKCRTPASRYREIRPANGLADRVACLWTQHIEGGSGQYRQRVLPDGCVDVVWIGQATPIVAGPATRRTVVAIPTGTTLYGVRFRPGWAANCLGLPMDELLDNEVQLDSLWGARAEQLSAQLFESDSEPVRLQALETSLVMHLIETKPPDKVLEESLGWLLRNPGGRLRDLARIHGYSERQLNRMFCRNVGYGPKMFQRIGRLQRVRTMSSTSSRSSLNLARLAADLGYADQAHMCREVRALANETPRALLSRRDSSLSMSDLFKNGN